MYSSSLVTFGTNFNQLKAQRITFFIIALLIISGCKHKKKPLSLNGDEPVDVDSFIDFFSPVSLPFQYADSSLQKKEKDSLLISRSNFTRFVPDSILTAIYQKNSKPSIYALGKLEVPRSETYLFVKTVLKDKKTLHVLAFDKKKEYITSLAILRTEAAKATSRLVSFDRKLTLTKTVSQKSPDGSSAEGRDVYVLNAGARKFMLIMTDPLIDKPTELINPIDTLARKNKFSADYGIGKMNLVSIRDGRRPGQLIFFIHFEKNNNACTGELKGEAIMRTTNTAEYREEGDPCVLKFIFSSSSVTLQEIEGCGSKRPLNCSLNGSFSKKKK